MTLEMRQFSILNFREFKKGTLLAFFDVELPSGLIIRDCMLHSKNGQRWVNPPSQKFTGKDSEIAYKRLVEFTSRELADKFRDECIAAIDAQQPQEKPEEATPDEEVPF